MDEKTIGGEGYSLGQSVVSREGRGLFFSLQRGIRRVFFKL
jgi:hypothetical protein